MSANASHPPAAASPARPDRVAAPRLAQAALVAAAAAVVANLLLWGIARGPLGVPGTFPPLQSAVATVVATVVGIAAGAVVFGVLLRFAPRPVTIFRALAAVGGVLSLGGPLGVASAPGASGAAIAVLVAMHLVTAAIAAWLLPRAAEAR